MQRVQQETSAPNFFQELDAIRELVRARKNPSLLVNKDGKVIEKEELYQKIFHLRAWRNQFDPATTKVVVETSISRVISSPAFTEKSVEQCVRKAARAYGEIILRSQKQTTTSKQKPAPEIMIDVDALIKAAGKEAKSEIEHKKEEEKEFSQNLPPNFIQNTDLLRNIVRAEDDSELLLDRNGHVIELEGIFSRALHRKSWTSQFDPEATKEIVETTMKSVISSDGFAEPCVEQCVRKSAEVFNAIIGRSVKQSSLAKQSPAPTFMINVDGLIEATRKEKEQPIKDETEIKPAAEVTA